MNATFNYKGPTTLVGSHLNNPEEIANFPQFPDSCKSLLRKHLSPNIWNELQNTKDKYGYSFKQAIYTGCKNAEGGSVGVFAGSPDSYKVFAKLFDKIICDYHQYGKKSKHKTDLAMFRGSDPDQQDSKYNLILSCRVRISRNIQGYPFGSNLDKDSRIKIMQSLIKAFSTLENELSGEFYELSGMSEDIQNQLSQEFLIFKLGDRFLEAGGFNRDWPEGRGVFHNKDKTLLAWINEEDHLRMISMEKGFRLFIVYARLIKACKHIEKIVPHCTQSINSYKTTKAIIEQGRNAKDSRQI